MIEIGDKTYLSESALIERVQELEIAHEKDIATVVEMGLKIRKARKILTTPSGAWDSEGRALSEKIERALAALEGK